MKVPLQVREIAEGKGLTLMELQQATGLAHNTIVAYWNKDIRQVNWRTLTRIAEVLGVQPKDLIKDEKG